MYYEQEHNSLRVRQIQYKLVFIIWRQASDLKNKTYLLRPLQYLQHSKFTSSLVARKYNNAVGQVFSIGG